jgi:hypothetical protein
MTPELDSDPIACEVPVIMSKLWFFTKGPRGLFALIDSAEALKSLPRVKLIRSGDTVELLFATNVLPSMLKNQVLKSGVLPKNEIPINLVYSDYDCHVFKPAITAGVFATRQARTAVAGTYEDALGREVASDTGRSCCIENFLPVSRPFACSTLRSALDYTRFAQRLLWKF